MVSGCFRCVSRWIVFGNRFGRANMRALSARTLRVKRLNDDRARHVNTHTFYTVYTTYSCVLRLVIYRIARSCSLRNAQAAYYRSYWLDRRSILKCFILDNEREILRKIKLKQKYKKTKYLKIYSVSRFWEIYYLRNNKWATIRNEQLLLRITRTVTHLYSEQIISDDGGQ